MVNNENAFCQGFCLEGGTPSYENLALDVSVNSLFQADIMCTKRTETEIATTITKNNHLFHEIQITPQIVSVVVNPWLRIYSYSFFYGLFTAQRLSTTTKLAKCWPEMLTHSLRAIFCKSHPTCDSRVFRISSYFSQLKIKVILEYGRNFSFIRHFVEFLGGRETTVVFQ